jgi:NhaP-type Na+/H+ or K+/H+ antiporter
LPSSKLIGAAPAAAGDHRRSGVGPATPDRRRSDIVSPLALLARLVSVALPLATMPGYRRGIPGAVPATHPGGPRGDISGARAVVVAGPERNFILAITYGVVVFSILVGHDPGLARPATGPALSAGEIERADRERVRDRRPR